MLSKTRAIVLNRIKYGDSSLIVRVLSEKHGKLSVMVHGVRKPKSRENPYLFVPFSLLQLDLYYRQERELQTLKEAKPLVLLQHLPHEIRKSTIALFLSEIVYKTLQEGENDPGLFDYLFHAIQILDVAQEGIENFHLLFLLQYSKYLGIHPRNHPELLQYLTPGNIQLSDLMDLSLNAMSSLRLTHSNRAGLLDRLVDYYHAHLEWMGEIKSLPVLREIFQ